MSDVAREALDLPAFEKKEGDVHLPDEWIKRQKRLAKRRPVDAEDLVAVARFLRQTNHGHDEWGTFAGHVIRVLSPQQ